MRGCYNTCISIFLEASRVRKEYDDASSKLSKIQSKISTLTEKLKHDFGECHLNFAHYVIGCSCQLYIIM
jgi:hypothetical protein